MIDEFGTLDLRDVVEIKDKKYLKNQQIKKVIIGNNIEKIGDNACRNCSNVEEIEFGISLDYSIITTEA